MIGDVLRAAEGAADGGGGWTAISEEAQCADREFGGGEGGGGGWEGCVLANR